MVAIFKIGVIKDLIPEINLENVEIKIVDGKHFIFDEESLREFEEYFIDDFHIIFLENGYLCRRPKWDREVKPSNFQFFHRFLMEKELTEKGKNFEVHHLTWCQRINIKKYLDVVSREVHQRLHESRLRDRSLMKQSKWIKFDN